MGCQLVLGIISTILALWLLFLAILAAMRQGGFTAEPADAPVAAFAKNGDDRSLPLTWALHRSRHNLVSSLKAADDDDQSAGSFLTTAAARSSSGQKTVATSAAPQSSPPEAPLANPSSAVPAFFVYGDSTVDVGNNNYLQTIARANLAPYGRDFDTHLPTGRFSNGRLSIDYLASFMGLPFIPPLLSRVNITSAMSGVNFASAGAGILSPSGSDLGQHIPMAEQVRHVGEVQHRLASGIGEGAANAIISNSIHYISIGSNDFIHYYLRNVSDVQNRMTNFEFNQLLISTLVGHIEDLYSRGIRKVAAIGIGPLGCVPFYLFSFNQTSEGCVDSINFMIAEYNNALRVTAQSLAMKHRNLKIVFCDVFDTIMPIVRNPVQFGFTTSRSACCGAGRFGGWLMCMFPQMACNNASSYLWWDEFHPTDKANSLLARDVWSGNACEPFNVQRLAAL